MLAIRCIPIFELSKSLNSKITEFKQSQEKLEAQIEKSKYENTLVIPELDNQIRELENKIQVCQEILFEIQLDQE